MIPKSGDRFSEKDHAQTEKAQMSESCNILVLGASGLIGRFVTDDLRARGFHVIGIARRFPPSQKTERARSGDAAVVAGAGVAGEDDPGP